MKRNAAYYKYYWQTRSDCDYAKSNSGKGVFKTAILFGITTAFLPIIGTTISDFFSSEVTVFWMKTLLVSIYLLILCVFIRKIWIAINY